MDPPMYRVWSREDPINHSLYAYGVCLILYIGLCARYRLSSEQDTDPALQEPTVWEDRKLTVALLGGTGG